MVHPLLLLSCVASSFVIKERKPTTTLEDFQTKCGDETKRVIASNDALRAQVAALSAARYHFGIE